MGAQVDSIQTLLKDNLTSTKDLVKNSHSKILNEYKKLVNEVKNRDMKNNQKLSDQQSEAVEVMSKFDAKMDKIEDEMISVMQLAGKIITNYLLKDSGILKLIVSF